MGLTYPQARQLLAARRGGASFSSTLTIGRLHLHLHRGEVKRLNELVGLSPQALEATQAFGDYADAFLCAALNIERLTALDMSAHEGALLLHDLNLPLRLDAQVDAVIDGGTLEHIFNAPVALSSYMRALKLRGQLFVAAPANNLCGHGFYQLSPEFFFRALGEDQGFQIRHVWLAEARYPSVELTQWGTCVEVRDPEYVRERVMLRSKRPVMIFVHAQKTHHVDDPLSVLPQQSDYQARWSEHGRGTRRRLAQVIPNRVLGVREQLRSSFRNRRFYDELE